MYAETTKQVKSVKSCDENAAVFGRQTRCICGCVDEHLQSISETAGSGPRWFSQWRGLQYKSDYAAATTEQQV